MTPSDLYAAQAAWQACESPEQAAAVLAQALGVGQDVERDLAFIIGGGDLRTYQTGYDDGHREGWDEGRTDLRSEIDMTAMRERIADAEAAVNATREKVEAALDETLERALKALTEAGHSIKEG